MQSACRNSWKSGKPVLPGGSSRWLCTCALPFCACLQVSTVHCDANLITRRAADANSVRACMVRIALMVMYMPDTGPA